MKPQSFIGLSAIAASMAGGTAFAQPIADPPATAEVQITASSLAACEIKGTFVAINVGDMLNKSNGGLNASTVNGKSTSISGTVLCNGVNSTLEVTAAPITALNALPPDADKAGFTNQVDYTATASLSGGVSSEGAFAIADKSGVVGGTSSKVGLLTANAGQFVVTLSDAALPGSAKYLMADKYSGSVTLTLAGVL